MERNNVVWLYPDADHNRPPRPYIVHSWPPVAGQEEETQTALDFPAGEERRGIPWLAVAVCFIGGGASLVGVLLLCNVVLPEAFKLYFKVCGC